MKKLKRVTCLVLTLMFSLLSVLFPMASVSADDYLKFHWKFDEGTGTAAADASGNTPSYPGTLYNGPTWISGGGLSFDGINDYARTNSAIPNSMGVSDQAYTLSASVRIPTGEQNGNIIHISNGANGIGWCISMLHLEAGKFRAIGWQSSQPVTAVAPTVANNNEWYSIANTWSPETDELRLYVNGVLVSATPMTSYMAAGENVYVFAGIDSGGCNNNKGWFRGDIKDVRIYNRAISQEEAEDNSNESLGIPPTSITTPTSNSAIRSWSPSVSWGDADECAYSWDNSSWTLADCSQNGEDIPAPSTDGSKHLYVRSNYTGETSYGIDDTTFMYDRAPPNVNAGDNTHTGTVPFTLSSATASDALSGLASYSWTKQSGPGAVTLSSGSVLNPNVTAISQNGTYVMRLTVADAAGNTAYDDFTLIWDTSQPTVQLQAFPDAITNKLTASFSFDGADELSEPVTYQCKLDGASFGACTSPVAYHGLYQGEHTFVVRATDSVGNISDDTDYTWEIIADQTNDTNGDGILDNQQTNLASLQSEDNGKTVALEVDPSCNVYAAAMKAERTHDIQDPGFDYPEGLLNFTLDCGQNGFTTTIKQYYYDVAPSNLVVRKHNSHTGAYFNIPNATITTETIYGQAVTVVTYEVTDGGVLDIDGATNGVIVDPAGLAVTVLGAPNTGLLRAI